MKIKYTKDMNTDFIHDVQEIDKIVYKESQCASFESDSARFEKNKDTYVLLYNDFDKLIGYMCVFPLTEEFTEIMLASNVGYDDNITPDDICDYSAETNLFILSIVVLPEYQNKEAIITLTNGYYQFIEEKEKANIHMKRILALAVSDDGKRILDRLGLDPHKELDDGYTLFIKQ